MLKPFKNNEFEKGGIRHMKDFNPNPQYSGIMLAKIEKNMASTPEAGYYGICSLDRTASRPPRKLVENPHRELSVPKQIGRQMDRALPSFEKK